MTDFGTLTRHQPFDFALELPIASGNGVNEGLQEPIL